MRLDKIAENDQRSPLGSDASGGLFVCGGFVVVVAWEGFRVYN